MSDLVSRIQRANRSLEVAIDIDALRAGVQRKRQTRARNRKLAAGAIVAGLVALGVAGLPGPSGRPAANDVASANPLPEEAPTDSGVATHLLSDDAQLETVVDTEDRAELRLSEGEARFEVDPDHHREVLVHAGFVTVEVTGTVFDVAHLPGERVRVGVERGRVRVDWPGGTTSLEVGTARVFERPSPADEPPAASGSVSNEDQSPRGWRALAHEGDHERAFELLEQAGASAVRDEPADLLLAADVARLSGHPARAIEPLSRLVREYPSDARAPSAAFTLGLLQLGGNPAAAAQSFATCRRLQPAGPLAQDALARQVEATSRAGNPSAARALAEQYVQAYPNGRRVNAVKRFGGL